VVKTLIPIPPATKERGSKASVEKGKSGQLLIHKDSNRNRIPPPLTWDNRNTTVSQCLLFFCSQHLIELMGAPLSPDNLNRNTTSQLNKNLCSFTHPKMTAAIPVDPSPQPIGQHLLATEIFALLCSRLERCQVPSMHSMRKQVQLCGGRSQEGKQFHALAGGR
jgi:hypothetical protein